MRKNDVMTAAGARYRTSEALYASVIEHLGDFVLPEVNEMIKSATKCGKAMATYRLNKQDFLFEDALTLASYLESIGYATTVYPENTRDDTYCVLINWGYRYQPLGEEEEVGQFSIRK